MPARSACARRLRLTALRAALLVRLTVATTSALAAAAAAAWPVSALAEETPAASVVLVVESAPWGVDLEAVREAIGREIGRAVAPADAKIAGRASLVLRSESGARVSLTYHAVDGKSIGRTIDLPSDDKRAVETIALLAGNLMRDEAAELAASLSKRPTEAPADAPAAADKPPAPSSADSLSAQAPSAPSAAQAPSATPAAQASSATPAAKASSGKPSVPPASTPALPETRSPCAHPGATFVLVGADVFPLLGTSTNTGTNVVRHYSANLLGGYTAGLAGVEIGAGINIESSFMCGAQLSGAANIVAGPVRGLQMTGGVNFGASLGGAQLGSLNIAWGPVAGAQVGLLDVAGPVSGAQLGVLNIAAGTMTGTQVGLVNVATDKVKGAQFGLVNYADRSSFSVGLLNIIRDGRYHLDLWGTESGLAMVGLKHGSDYFHNIYGVGALVYGTRARAALTLGVGGRIPFSERLYADVDVLGYSLHEVPSLEISTAIVQARVLLGARIASWFALYAGPSYNFAGSTVAEDSELSPYGSIALDPADTNPVRGWPGVVVGMQLF